MKPCVTAFFDETTFTASYVVAEPEGTHAAIIDSVLDYDPNSGRTSTASADAILNFVRTEGLVIDWILETHAHADHFTAAPYLKSQLGAPTGIGARITEVQAAFKEVFHVENGFATDGSQFDRLFEDGETFRIGAMSARVMHSPGHTPACVTYLMGNTAFVGDTLFMPDFGTARCDFPGGDAATLYRSIQTILSLPEETRLFLCHDYKAPGRDDYVWETTVGEELDRNIHVHRGVTEDDFVRMRTERDSTLRMPALILPAVQVNMRAGNLPPAESNGVSYLKIPVNAL